MGPADEVLTVPYTFFATAGAIANVGARPVFVDILPDSFNMDPGRLEAALRRPPEGKGRDSRPPLRRWDCAEMDSILAAAGRHSMLLIEDAAQAIGAEYRGRQAGSMGRIGCLASFLRRT